MPRKLRRDPVRIISPIVIKRDEYATAEAGVPIGNIKAKLLVRMTVIATMDGLIP